MTSIEIFSQSIRYRSNKFAIVRSTVTFEISELWKYFYEKNKNKYVLRLPNWIKKQTTTI